jgi:hypothetical protein
MGNTKDEKYLKFLEKIKEVKEHYKTVSMVDNYSHKDRKSMEKTFINTMIADYFTRNVISHLVDA